MRLNVVRACARPSRSVRDFANNGDGSCGRAPTLCGGLGCGATNEPQMVQLSIMLDQRSGITCGLMSGDSAQSKQAVQASVRVAAPIDRVWSAWTEKERLAEWFPERFEGEVEVGREVVFAGDAVGVDLPLEVVSVEPHKRLRFRAARPESTVQRVEVRFRNLDGQATMVRLEHSGFGSSPDDRAVRDRTASSWQTVMAISSLYVERNFGRKRVVKSIFAKAEVSFLTLYRHYTDAELLRRWLTTSGSVGAAGDSLDLVLDEHLRLRGEVLSRDPGRNVVLHCSELGGVLVLCGCPASNPGLASRLGAWICTWDLENPLLARLEEYLQAAVQRLANTVSPDAIGP